MTPEGLENVLGQWNVEERGGMSRLVLRTLLVRVNRPELTSR